MALAIIHSWKTPQTAARFLLVGEAPILILVHDRTSDPDGAKNLMEVMSTWQATQGPAISSDGKRRCDFSRDGGRQ